QTIFVGTGESYTSGQATGNGIWRSTDGGQTWTHVFGGQDGKAQFITNANMTINTPGELSGTFNAVIGGFGDTNFDNFSGNLVLTNDGSSNPTFLACNALVNASEVNGNIAVIQRGDCNFVDKVKNAQNSGAIGVLMINNVSGNPIIMGGDDSTITIPAVMISKDDGQAIIDALQNNEAVNITVNNNHTDIAMGYLVPGITNINDVVTRNNNGVTEIYATAGDSNYRDASLFTVLGHGYQGVYKSVDNGDTWQKVNLPLDPAGKAFNPFDLEISADNKIWVTTTRSSVNGVDHGAVLSSSDGDHFQVVLPVANVGRMELAVSKTNPGKMYLIAVNYSFGNGVPTLYKTTNAFASRTSLSNPSDGDLGGNDFTNGQAFYDLFIDVDPNNDETVFIGGINIFKSTNGGTNWTQISSYYGNTSTNTIHPDQHGIAFGDSQHILFGNDGGVAYSDDGGQTIIHRNNKYNVTQFYHMGVAPTTAFTGDYFIAGAQDNGTQLFANAPLAVANTVEVQGGDGAYSFFDQDGTEKYTISNYIYNKSIQLYNHVNNTRKTINSETDSNGDFINQEALDSNLNILYSNYSTSGTYAIRRYSNLLGTLSKSTIEDPLLNSSPTALKVSPYTTNSSKLFIGLQNGKLLKVNNANGLYQFFDITGDEFVGSISDIEFGQNENEILVTIFNYGVESVFYTNDSGQTWVSKEGNLPDIPVNTILQNPLNTNEVIIGTDLGVWATPNFNDVNPTWYQTYNGMSDVKVTDLELRDDNTVFAATFGRGVFSGTFDSSASLSSNDNIVNVKVFPNPAVDQIQVQLPKAISTIASVYDINGREVMKKTLKDGDRCQFNVSHLPKGNYFVSLQNGQTKYIAKFIKN
ncbi:MAG TPA: T9SS type A sorting domain-containing protein, partial [Flavobacteriales bacterium]|nr:T9SS type A sorting domain-containing protein [Flavobacteriales bacterium]